MIYYIKKIKVLLKGILKSFSFENRELRRISKIRRYTKFNTTILGKKLLCGDSLSFIGQYNEIIKRRIYKFLTNEEEPYIIDCGSNIGLSIIYFKILYPNSKIIAFEPDPSVFEILVTNIKNFKLKNITAIQKGVWYKDGKIDFCGDGDDSGRIIQNENQDGRKITIEVESLLKYLNKPVDLLKIDIEGAELEVIKSIDEILYNVRNVFIEYHSRVDVTQSLHIILEILKRNQFRYYLESTTINNISPLINKESYNGFDNFINIYGFKANSNTE